MCSGAGFDIVAGPTLLILAPELKVPMSYKIITTIQGKSSEKMVSDKTSAIMEAIQIRKLSVPAESLVFDENLMVACISHSPQVKKNRRWRS